MDTKGGVTIPWYCSEGEEKTMIRNAWAQAKVLAGWEEAWLCVCVCLCILYVHVHAVHVNGTSNYNICVLTS